MELKASHPKSDNPNAEEAAFGLAVSSTFVALPRAVIPFSGAYGIKL
jgi:hypothetical protein